MAVGGENLLGGNCEFSKFNTTFYHFILVQKIFDYPTIFRENKCSDGLVDVVGVQSLVFRDSG